MWGEGCSVVSDSLWPHGLYSPLNSPGQNPGVGSLSLLQGIFPTQGSNTAGGFFTSWATREAWIALHKSLGTRLRLQKGYIYYSHHISAAWAQPDRWPSSLSQSDAPQTWPYDTPLSNYHRSINFSRNISFSPCAEGGKWTVGMSFPHRKLGLAFPVLLQRQQGRGWEGWVFLLSLTL